MAKLSASARKKIPSSKFGLPEKAKTASGKAKSGSYPMNDAAHARSALRLMHNASPAQQKQIAARAHAMLGDTKKKKK